MPVPLLLVAAALGRDVPWPHRAPGKFSGSASPEAGAAHWRTALHFSPRGASRWPFLSSTLSLGCCWRTGTSSFGVSARSSWPRRCCASTPGQSAHCLKGELRKSVVTPGVHGHSPPHITGDGGGNDHGYSDASDDEGRRDRSLRWAGGVPRSIALGAEAEAESGPHPAGHGGHRCLGSRRYGQETSFSARVSPRSSATMARGPWWLWGRASGGSAPVTTCTRTR